MNVIFEVLDFLSLGNQLALIIHSSSGVVVDVPANALLGFVVCSLQANCDSGVKICKTILWLNEVLVFERAQNNSHNLDLNSTLNNTVRSPQCITT